MHKLNMQVNLKEKSDIKVIFGSLGYSQPGQPAAVLNPCLPTVPTFAVRETDVSRHNGGTSGAPLKPLRDDSALRALSFCTEGAVEHEPRPEKVKLCEANNGKSETKK